MKGLQESGGKEEQQDINMNKYKITRVVYAHSIVEAESILSGGETAWIELVDENTNEIGFHKKEYGRERD